MQFVSLISEGILNGFFLVTILLLVCRITLPKYRQIINRLILFFNTLLLVGSTVYLFVAVQQFIVQITASDEYEAYSMVNRITGPYWLAYWGALLFNGFLPQLMWIRRLRRSLGASLVLAPFLLVDYWLPLLVSSLHRDYLPSTWSMMQPNYYGLAIAGITYLTIFLLLFSMMQLIKKS